MDGIFITFEGDDGVGKSTHAARLAEALRALGFDVLCLREPGNTRIGEKLRAVLLDADNAEMADECELLIYEAARAQLVREVLEPALQAGKVVICDRFTDSTCAYQAAGRGLDAGFVEAANRFATAGLQPDLTVLLELPDSAEKARRIEERGQADRMELAGSAFHERVSCAFHELPAAQPERVVRVVAAASEDATAQRVMEAVRGRISAIAARGSHG